jgi:transcriptional regulator with XRE-family HTH domain
MSGQVPPHARAAELRGQRYRVYVAKELGITDRQLRRIERGEYARGPNRRTRAAYLRVFGEDPWAQFIESRPRDRPTQARRAEPDAAAVELGRRLKARRKELGLTQQAAAAGGRERFRDYARKRAARFPDRRYFGTAGPVLYPSAISRLECGHFKRANETTIALALALDIDHDAWFGPPYERWMAANMDELLGLA